MLQSDLTQANKAIRLRHFDTATKSKAIISVKWHLLGGNKHPYLSVDIKSVVSNGKTVHGWKEQKEALKDINQDFYNLASYHLTDLSCKVSDAGYHLKLVRDQLGKTIYTNEQFQQDKAELRQRIKDHSILTLLEKQLGSSIVTYIKEYQDPNKEEYQYFNADRAFKHWDQQIAKRFNTGLLNKWNPKKSKQPTPQNQLKNYFDLIGELKELKQKYKYKTLLNNSGLWTVERFCNEYSVSELDVYQAVANPLNTELQNIIENNINDKVKKDLTALTEKYNIPLVITK